MGEGPSDAKIMVIGEAPGADEVLQGHPFIGESGKELDRMLADAGLLRSQCYVTNVFKSQPPNNQIEFFLDTRKGKSYEKGFVPYRGRFIRDDLRSHIEHLEREIEAVNPDILVALGDTALWATTGNSGITKWRSSIIASHLRRPGTGRPYKVIPTFHPAGVLRNWPWRFLAVHDLRRVATELQARGPEIYTPNYEFTIRPNYNQVREFLLGLRSQLDLGPVKFSCDTETRRKHIACVGIGVSKLRALCIPFMCVERAEGYWTLEEEVEIVLALRAVLCHPNARLTGQNWIYDAQYFINDFGFAPLPLWMDTMLAHHVLFNSLPKGLDFLASLYCEFPLYWKSEGKEWDPKIMPEEQLWAYNCKDCTYTFECAENIEAAIEATGMQAQFQFQHDLFPAVLRMMVRGCNYDHSLKPQLSDELTKSLDERLQYFKDILGHDFNPNSNNQMRALFYDDLKQKVIKDRKTKQPTLADEALQEIARREPLLGPLIQGIGEYRSARVFKSTFIDAETGVDRRMRCSYNIAGTKTYRFSSSEDAFYSGMNLQNLPKGTQSAIMEYLILHGNMAPAEEIRKALDMSEVKFAEQLSKAEEDGIVTVSNRGSVLMVHYRFSLPNVRRLFIPDDGYTIIDMDLDRADLQVVVWESGDEELKRMLREGIDMHSENALLLGCSRQMAKVFVHGTDYGGTARTMAINCGITVHRADQMQKRWFGAHPGILEWQKRQAQSLYATRSVQTAFGFKGWFFDRIESIIPDALAWVPQATVGYVINSALRLIDKNISTNDVQILLQVHDSLTMQVHKAAMPNILNTIRQNSLLTIPYEDPLVIPVSFTTSTKSWGAVKPLEDVYPDFRFAA